MKIKEEDSQHLVIVSTFRERLIGVFFTVIASIMLAVLFYFFPNLPTVAKVAIVVPLIVIHLGVRTLMGRSIVLDKSTDSVILEAPNLLLTRKKRIIPFTDIEDVEITYKRISSEAGPRDEWQVSLYTGGRGVYIDRTTDRKYMYTAGKMVYIDQATDRECMSSLADKISRFMGKEVVDHSRENGNGFT